MFILVSIVSSACSIKPISPMNHSNEWRRPASNDGCRAKIVNLFDSLKNSTRILRFKSYATRAMTLLFNGASPKADLQKERRERIQYEFEALQNSRMVIQKKQIPLESDVDPSVYTRLEDYENGTLESASGTDYGPYGLGSPFRTLLSESQAAQDLCEGRFTRTINRNTSWFGETQKEIVFTIEHNLRAFKDEVEAFIVKNKDILDSSDEKRLAEFVEVAKNLLKDPDISSAPGFTQN